MVKLVAQSGFSIRTSYMHRIFQEQILPVSREDLWDFVSVPQNLNQITPPDLAFKIKGKPPEKAYPGLLLEYEVKILCSVRHPG